MFKKIDPIISFFFPKRCLSCRVLLPYSHPDFFCTDCRAQIIFLKEPWCEKCGDIFSNEEISSHLCQDCLSEAPAFEKARSLLQLNDVLIPLIYRLKYQAMRHLIKWSRPFLKEFFDHHFSDSSVDLVMPIPLHTTRLLKRGYNQSLLIAKSLAA
ncbi:MAG: ComF family protein, partial [Deltaproteobacteria bacterium]|nr:ComF family protein [Deltaproteobacteria bacterium]